MTLDPCRAGLVHLLYLAPDVDAFSLESRWVPETLRRPVALGLLAVTVLSFTLVALSTWGVPGLSETGHRASAR